MRALITAIGLFFTFGLISVPVAGPHELSGHIAAEGRVFFHDALFPGQKRNNGSLVLQPEYYHEWENGSSFIFVPFARLDSVDSRRRHLDIRELNYLWLADTWELRVGVGKVFWGTTEFVHLVDIINQTDLVENIDEEDKLGQPMVHLSVTRDWGIVDMFVLPYFRERTFPGLKGRLRLDPEVDTDNPKFDSQDENRHVDFAMRYSHTIGDWDMGIYYFKGTGREPTLLPDFNNRGDPVLVPFYEQINQIGSDVQVIAGKWLWKLEALYRLGQGNGFLSTVGGFEYTFVRIAETSMDLGVIGEWVYDDRGDSATTPLENDLMLGLRLAVNDAPSSELLAGIFQDIGSSSRSMVIEAGRRIGNNIKATFEVRAFFGPPEDDLLFSLRNDDFLQIELAYYY